MSGVTQAFDSEMGEVEVGMDGGEEEEEGGEESEHWGNERESGSPLLMGNIDNNCDLDCYSIFFSTARPADDKYRTKTARVA